MAKAVIGLGTNMGNRGEYLRQAAGAISLLPGTKTLSATSVYRTAPWGVTDQPDFYNMHLLVETGLSPSALLGALLGIEATLGRVRTRRYGPRVIDLDLLYYEGMANQTEELTLPHPRIPERDFVLVPLTELFPDGNALGWSFPLTSEAEGVEQIGSLDEV
ncbi:MAG: 2-amino-4-hydroxy-6-hydroxymethyldihydropteridine diphosphokinase [Oscillospiraceae bacterium]|nr:2-amino-4-hydroxy-6-hydroxymethyldihydropteridine diphosphokinase [Oscillospiraceae bacterium]MBQ8732002.1 2-amino-4-hydroxy-6-hydroxymethyldihydropteridine diphosphokinase [Oscillospiraceae bacterium]